MNKQTTWIWVIAALLVLATSLYDPELSAGVAVALMIGIGAWQLGRNKVKGKRLIILAVAAFLIAFLVAGALRLMKNESGGWNCQNGQWVSFGDPINSAPPVGCPSEQATSTTRSLNQEINFVRSGVAVLDEPGRQSSNIYLVYEEPGKPALKLRLLIDGKSFCGSKEQKIVCMALSVSNFGLFNGKPIKVIGIRSGDTVSVRELNY